MVSCWSTQKNEEIPPAKLRYNWLLLTFWDSATRSSLMREGKSNVEQKKNNLLWSATARTKLHYYCSDSEQHSLLLPFDRRQLKNVSTSMSWKSLTLLMSVVDRKSSFSMLCCVYRPSILLQQCLGWNLNPFDCNRSWNISSCSKATSLLKCLRATFSIFY